MIGSAPDSVEGTFSGKPEEEIARRSALSYELHPVSDHKRSPELYSVSDKNTSPGQIPQYNNNQITHPRHPAAVNIITR